MKKLIVFLLFTMCLQACDSDFWNKKIEFDKIFKESSKVEKKSTKEEMKEKSSTSPDKIISDINKDQINLDNLADTLIKEIDDKKAMDLVWELPEVKERAKYVEKQTNGKRKLIIWACEYIDDAKSDFYWIKVGEDNGNEYVTHFNFYVYAKTQEIKFYDVVNDKIISISKWRKSLINKAVNKK